MGVVFKDAPHNKICRSDPDFNIEYT